MLKNQPYGRKIIKLYWILVTVLPITPEKIGGRFIIYHKVTNIKLYLALHQYQDV